MTTSEDVRSKTNPDLLTSTGQVFLVGEQIYLRPLTRADAEYASAWRGTVFPQAPERVRGWIDDEFTGSNDKYTSTTLLIVRKSDDRPVGSVTVRYRSFPHHDVSAYVDPLTGEQGLGWKAEALTLAVSWLADEQQRPKVGVNVPSHEAPVIEALEKAGMRRSATFREKLARPGGGRSDELVFEQFNQDWMKRLGDPAEVSFPRTGTGVARPVTVPVPPEGDPPANAIRIGPRVYLRPPQESDARAHAHFSVREIDTNWDNGRQPFGAEGTKKWFEEMQKQTPPDTIDLSVCLRETDEYIGVVAVLGVDYHHRFAESASMMMNPAYRETGYGSEAKHLMFDYVFDSLGLHSLQSYVMFENPRSAAALRKQGYREAGRDHWIEWRNGSFVSFVALDLLASDWRAMPRTDTEST